MWHVPPIAVASYSNFTVNAVVTGYKYDLASIRRPFDCLSKVTKAVMLILVLVLVLVLASLVLVLVRLVLVLAGPVLDKSYSLI